MTSTPVLDAAETGGALALVRHDLPAGTDVAGPHEHAADDTWHYVLEGDVRISLGDETVAAAQGDLVTVPRGTRHAVAPGDGAPARTLEIVSPADGAPPLPDGPPVLRAAEGERAQIGPMGVRFMIDAQATGGRFSLVEHPLAPLGLAAPVHTHSREAEWSYVLYGEMGAEADGRTLVARGDDLVRKARGPHAFWNAIDGPTSLLEFIVPGGFERYFAELAPLLESGDVERIPGVMARYGLEMDLPSAERLAREHGLAGAREDLGPR